MRKKLETIALHSLIYKSKSDFLQTSSTVLHSSSGGNLPKFELNCFWKYFLYNKQSSCAIPPLYQEHSWKTLQILNQPNQGLELHKPFPRWAQPAHHLAAPLAWPLVTLIHYSCISPSAAGPASLSITQGKQSFAFNISNSFSWIF